MQAMLRDGYLIPFLSHGANDLRSGPAGIERGGASAAGRERLEFRCFSRAQATPSSLSRNA